MMKGDIEMEDVKNINSMTIYIKIWIFLQFSFLSFSCNHSVDDPAFGEPLVSTGIRSSPVMEVKVVPAIREAFKTTIYAQGNLQTLRKMELLWNAEGYITELNVQDGEEVGKDHLLARLSIDRLEEELIQARINLEKAALIREDMRIMRMVDTVDSDPEKLRNIDLHSGFRQAEFDIERIEKQILRQRIMAPFHGVLYDVENEIGSFVIPGKPFAKILDHQNYQVEFKVLESDMGKLRTGQPVEIRSLTGQFPSFETKIRQILPVVDEQGMVRIMTSDRRNPGSFYDGMKVRVLVVHSIPDQVVIPREAVVIRSGEKVVFVYNPDTGRVEWRYIKTGLENETSMTVLEGIEDGEKVVIEGNLNLNHDAAVSIIESESSIED